MNEAAVMAVAPGGNTLTQLVDSTWNMARFHMNMSSPEVVLPMPVYRALGDAGVTAICNKFSTFIGAEVVQFRDRSLNAVRIIRRPALPVRAGAEEEVTEKDHGVKARIPRPPNAFILYRQFHHPLLKAADPNIHNNEISVILGEQWKIEDVATKEYWKAQARTAKLKHAAEYPDYTYQPRKSSEKKRRMTRRKRADITAKAEADSHIKVVATDATPSSATGTHDAASSATPHSVVTSEASNAASPNDSNHEASNVTSPGETDFERMLAGLPSPTVPHFNLDEAGNAMASLPMGDNQFMAMMNNWNTVMPVAGPEYVDNQFLGVATSADSYADYLSDANEVDWDFVRAMAEAEAQMFGEILDSE